VASGKSESSELAKRFCLRGRFPGGPAAKASAFGAQRSRGPGGRSGAEKGEVFVWYVAGVCAGFDLV
jgi:hypothetical protein